NHGTLTNMNPETDWVDGKIGSALDFDGIDDYVEVPDSASLDITEEITIEAWVKPDSVSGYHAILDKAGSYIFLTHNDELFFYLHNPDGFKKSSGLNLETGVWQHVAITFDRNNLRFYKNGTSYTPTEWPHSISSSNNAVRIGTDNWNEFFNGIIDEVKIYNRALSAEEIMAHYEEG
ncbi:MAG: LamG domain-containing protein, partial [Thermoplasmatales archaeon]|nr:LamG domain-containing protein [Thermoplasmatales archaeon]